MSQVTALRSGADIPSAVRTTLSAALQPIVRLDGQVLGHEGLLRGALAPDELFGEARKGGWSEALDLRAVELALEAAVAWTSADQLVFVNAAPMPVPRLASWLRAVTSMAAWTGVSADRLVIELNEHQTGAGLSELALQLSFARALGLRFALDDVDGGARCRRFVTVLRPEFVKLDGSIVHALSAPGTAGKVRSLVLLCRDVGAVLIAEKVETEAQVDRLAALGIWHFQGRLIGLPVAGSPPSTRGWRRAS